MKTANDYSKLTKEDIDIICETTLCCNCPLKDTKYCVKYSKDNKKIENSSAYGALKGTYKNLTNKVMPFNRIRIDYSFGYYEMIDRCFNICNYYGLIEYRRLVNGKVEIRTIDLSNDTIKMVSIY